MTHLGGNKRQLSETTVLLQPEGAVSDTKVGPTRYAPGTCAAPDASPGNDSITHSQSRDARPQRQDRSRKLVPEDQRPDVPAPGMPSAERDEMWAVCVLGCIRPADRGAGDLEHDFACSWLPGLGNVLDPDVVGTVVDGCLHAIAGEG